MQFSLFGAAAVAPTVADLDGVVLAGGQWVHATVAGRSAARLSVLVDAPWRAAALLAEFQLRNIRAEQALTEVSDLIDVRTDFSADLLADAQRWTRGARLVAPTELSLGGGGLRLWPSCADAVTTSVTCWAHRRWTARSIGPPVPNSPLSD